MNALVTHPWASKPVPVLPTAVKVDVMAGLLYELTTDAQLVDGVTGAVTYPLLYVVDGTDVKTFSRKMAMPFHRMRPIVVQPASNSLIVSGDIVATVWVARLVLPEVIVRAPVPGGGADCSCKKPSALDLRRQADAAWDRGEKELAERLHRQADEMKTPCGCVAQGRW